VPTTFEWTVEHPCSDTLIATKVSLEGIPADWIKSIYVSDDALTAKRTVRASISFAQKRYAPYQVQLVAKEDDGTVVPLGDPVSVRVHWGIPEYAQYYGPRIGVVLFFLHAAVFTALIIGARWFAWCWLVLTDPVWGKTGLWFYFLLRHVGPLQRWIMTPWFEAVRKETSSQPYLPRDLSDNGKHVARSPDLLDHAVAPPRLWVQGNPGMGKTVTVLYLQSAFFTDPNLPTLAKAFARFGSIPIIVPLRDYRTVAFDRGQPGDWVAKVARLAVSAYGLPFKDHSLFRAMIASGGFLLMLDGANEVEEEREAEIEQFARATPAVRLLVTSQVPGSQFFTNWRLPNNIREEIKPLLCLFLGQDTGEYIFARIQSTPLRDAIRSGYDVRLIADLIEDQGRDVALPEDRLGLYQLVLDTIRMPDGSQFPEERLCQAAWLMWKEGARKLIPGENLDEDLLKPLIHEHQKVLRILEGQQYEFRHDQMRAYLAARWAAHHETQPISLFEKESAIWRLSRQEQDEVWGFFADMYVTEQPQEAVVLWKWSTAHRDRVNLQHALQRALEESDDPALFQNALASLVAS